MNKRKRKKLMKKHAHDPAATDAGKASPSADPEKTPIPDAGADIPADAAAPAEAAETAAPAAEAADNAAPQPSPEDVLKDRLLRLQADFDNYKKRQARERLDWIAGAAKDVVSELLPVLDNFERGLQSVGANPEHKALLDGFSMIYTQLQNALQKAGVAEIPAEGLAFDTAVHDAVTTMPSADVPEGHVAAVARRGYTLNGKLLRPAQVVVSSGPAAAAAAQP